MFNSKFITNADPLAMFVEIAHADFIPSSEKSFDNFSESRCALLQTEDDNSVSVLLYLRGSAHVLVPTKSLLDIKIEWSCNGTLDGAEINHIKNSWRMCKVTMPSLIASDIRIPFHYYCNNTDFADSNISDETGIFVPIKGMNSSSIVTYLKHLKWEKDMKYTCHSQGVPIPNSDEEWSILNF